MKKIVVALFIVMSVFLSYSVYATSDNILEGTTAGQLVEIKDKELNELEC